MRSDGERRARRRAGGLSLLVVGLLLAPLPVAAETTQSDLVLIREGDVVGEDLYAAGNRIDIDGVIEGDLVAAAFGETRIDGRVDGSVTVLSGRVVIAGAVGESVRTAGGEVVIEGDVGGDVVVAAGTVTVARGGSVGRDVIGAVWRGEVAGSAGRNIEGVFRTLDVGGRVEGSVDVGVRSLVVGETAVIEGDLAYRSSRPAAIADGAVVEGSSLERTPLSPNVRIIGLGLLLRALLAVFAAGLGLSVVWSSPARAERAAAALGARPLISIGWGAAVVALPLVLVGGVVGVASLMPPEAGIPLAVVSLPVLFAVLGVILIVALVAPVPPAIVVGSRLASRRSLYGRFLLGFAALAVLGLIPIVGRILVVATATLGIGAWITQPPRDARPSNRRESEEREGPTDGAPNRRTR